MADQFDHEPDEMDLVIRCSICECELSQDEQSPEVLLYDSSDGALCYGCGMAMWKMNIAMGGGLVDLEVPPGPMELSRLTPEQRLEIARRIELGERP